MNNISNYYNGRDLNIPYLLASQILAMIKTVIPTNINDVCIPKNTEDSPKSNIPTISHNLETNSSTPEIAHSSF